MNAGTPLCTTAYSGWRPESTTPVDFRTRGKVLSVELRRWTTGASVSVSTPADLGEEMGAVLEGRYELTCEGERYELGPGDGILIPAGEPHTWRLLSGEGVLYRVCCPESAPV
jgi:quercetin dioxygenase-like cupin family protein